MQGERLIENYDEWDELSSLECINFVFRKKNRFIIKIILR